jgi:hypothetical protein
MIDRANISQADSWKRWTLVLLIITDIFLLLLNGNLYPLVFEGQLLTLYDFTRLSEEYTWNI